MPSKDWGPKVSTGSGAKLTAKYDSITVDGSTAKLKNPRVEFYSKSGWYDSVNSISTKTGATTAKSLHSGTLNGGTRSWNATARDVALQYGKVTKADFVIEVSGISFFNGDSSTDTYRWTIEFPARPYSTPPVPASVVATYVDDTRADLAITHRSAGSGNPISNTLVERSTDGGKFEQVVSLKGAASNWSDTTISKDHKYEYRVRTANPSRKSGYAAANVAVFTTPATPSVVTAAKNGVDIEVSFVDGSRWASSFNLQDNPGGIWGWDGAGLPAATESPFIVLAPNPAQTHEYRVQAVAPDGRLSLWSLGSNVVQLQGRPNAPVGLFAGAVDRASDVDATYLHNPVDTTRQRMRQGRWRAQGAVDWVYGPEDTTDVQVLSWAVGVLDVFGKHVEYQVRTKGDHKDWSDWSASAVLILSDLGSVNVTKPDGTLTSGKVVGEWGWFDPAGGPQTGWRATLLIGGVEVETRAGSGTADSVVFRTYADDGASVQVKVEARNQDGLWSEPAYSDIQDVVYALPIAPVVEVNFDPDTGQAEIIVLNSGDEVGDDSGLPEVLGNRLYVIDPDGTQRIIDDRMEPNSVAVDMTPVLGKPVTYILETDSDAPSTRVTEISVTFDAEQRYWLTTSSGESVWLGYDPNEDIDIDTGIEKFHPEGRTWPVGRDHGRREMTINFSSKVFSDEALTWAEMQRFALTGENLVFRTPDGMRFWAIPHKYGTNRKRASVLTIDVSLSRTGSSDKVRK